MSNQEDELDTSWANEEHQEDMIDKEPMPDILCWILYIDVEGTLRHVFKDKLILDEIEPTTTTTNHARKLSRNRLLQFIHTKKVHIGVKYRMTDILLYHIDLEPNQLMEKQYISSAGNMTTLKEVTLQDEIKIPPALCIFHDINCLYFLFKELPTYDDDDDDDDERLPPKPTLTIMSNCSLPKGRRKKTKKVTFNDTTTTSDIPSFRFTRKRIEPTTSTAAAAAATTTT
jgi:hypothetical protein